MEKLPAPSLPDWLDSQLPFQRYLVEVSPGLRMHVMEQGEGRPVLLFHGNPTWGYLYRKVAEQLAGESYRLIMPDLIGLGLSDRPTLASDHTLSNHSRWMAGLLDGLSLDSPIAVVQDWGGPVGVHSLSTRPGLMSGLVVMNTSLTAPKPGFKPTLFHRVFGTRLGDVASRYLGVPQRFLGMAQGDRSSISKEETRAYMYPLTRERGNEAVAALVRMVPDDLHHPTVEPLKELAAYVAEFDGPSAIVWGKKDPVLGRLLNRHVRLLPRATVFETEAGHFLQEEVPEEIAEAIRAVS